MWDPKKNSIKFLSMGVSLSIQLAKEPTYCAPFSSSILWGVRNFSWQWTWFLTWLNLGKWCVLRWRSEREIGRKHMMAIFPFSVVIADYEDQPKCSMGCFNSSKYHFKYSHSNQDLCCNKNCDFVIFEMHLTDYITGLRSSLMFSWGCLWIQTVFSVGLRSVKRLDHQP